MANKRTSRTDAQTESPAQADSDGQDPINCFEANLSELEKIVQQMEGGELTLEQSLKLFERGSQLGKSCRASLEKAELRIQELTPDAQPPETENPPKNDAFDDGEIPF